MEGESLDYDNGEKSYQIILYAKDKNGQGGQSLGKDKLHHSVLEWIWVKGSYLSKWLPQGERGPPKESKSRWIEILHIGSH